MVRAYESKILDADAMLREREQLRTDGQTLVFTNGCFDLLNEGHVDYLSFAGNQGDKHIISINSDSSVRQLKGEERPLTPQDDRA
mgnify:CR=1 FL=1